MFSIRAESLSKEYQLYRAPIDSLKELFLRRRYAETFWAVRDVSFEVLASGSIGIIGENGAGKSTLLKLLAGALTPSSGRVDRSGRVGAILQLGAGFHPDLSGLENIRIGCAVLGLSPAETEYILPRIVEFSELGHFIERPLRTYSSGMHLRLGFSVATAIDPDILIVDEHLSVGDQHFRFKCMRRIMALRETGCALVFCSHDLFAVGEVCERSLWMEGGHSRMLGDTQSVLKAYQDHEREKDASFTDSSTSPEGVTLHDQQKHAADNYLREFSLGGDVRNGGIETGNRLELRIVAELNEAAWRDGVHVGLLIVRNDAVWCYGISTKMEGMATGLHPLGGNSYGITFIIDHLSLLSGQYSFTVALMDDCSPLVYHTCEGAAPFTVRHAGKEVGVARIPHRWELK
ncbi:MAG: transporter [Rhodocyclales bacterium]|nr:transporter [Rhodocyclales bacterium]